jgi:hypothetical protein
MINVYGIVLIYKRNTFNTDSYFSTFLSEMFGNHNILKIAKFKNIIPAVAARA